MEEVKKIKIEQNIPLAPDRRGRKKLYHFESMKPGDSFFSPTKNAVSAAYHWGRVHGVKFEAHQVQGGYRVWRIE